MGFFTRFRPARSMALQDIKVVSNLDDILTQPVAFILHGKTHYLEPLNTETFFRWSECLAQLFELKNQDKLPSSELLDAYDKLFRSVCPTITRSDIAECKQSQIAALLSVLLDHVSGRVKGEEYGKKKVMEVKRLETLQ